jgi:hypothetical protein
MEGIFLRTAERWLSATISAPENMTRSRRRKAATTYLVNGNMVPIGLPESLSRFAAAWKPIGGVGEQEQSRRNKRKRSSEKACCAGRKTKRQEQRMNQPLSLGKPDLTVSEAFCLAGQYAE